MKQALLKFTLWDQPAGVVERHGPGKPAGSVSIHCIKMRQWVAVEEDPRIGARLQIPGWDCGTVESVLWDEERQAYAIAVSDIFVEDGSEDQRETDFWVLRNAAVLCGWDDAAPVQVVAPQPVQTLRPNEAQRSRGLFGLGKPVRKAA